MVRRGVSEEESALLKRAMRDVKPLKRRAKKKANLAEKRASIPAYPGERPKAERESPLANQSPTPPRLQGGEPRRESQRPSKATGRNGDLRPGSGLAVGLPPYPPSALQRGGGEVRRQKQPVSAFSSGDPKIETKARRGRIEIARTLDLHDLRQAAALSRLKRFLETAYKDDCRCVLVVTGKGAPVDRLSAMAGRSPRGVIRLRFLEWIEEPPLRAIVARAARAAPRHGGDGAFYVFLKGRRS